MEAGKLRWRCSGRLCAARLLLISSSCAAQLSSSAAFQRCVSCWWRIWWRKLMINLYQHKLPFMFPWFVACVVVSWPCRTLIRSALQIKAKISSAPFLAEFVVLPRHFRATCVLICIRANCQGVQYVALSGKSDKMFCRDEDKSGCVIKCFAIWNIYKHFVHETSTDIVRSFLSL